MPVVDVLITKYELDSSKYQSDAKKVEASTEKMGVGINSLMGKIGNAASSSGGLGQFGSAITQAIQGMVTLGAESGPVGLVVVAALAAIAAEALIVVAGEALLIKTTIDLGSAAVSAAADFERMEATFGGALGSMEKGKEVMAGLQDYADTSAFHLKDLAAASTQLVASGLNLKSILPVAERFALIVSGTDPAGLTMVASAMARIKGGSFGEAMEIFRRAGVSNDDLRAQGIKVGKSGEINATPKQMMDAIIKISEGRPKAMADAISGTNIVKLGNFGDALDKAKVSLGKTILAGIVPTIEKWTKGINDFVKSGGMQRLGEQMNGFIAKFGLDKLDFTDVAGMVSGFGAAVYEAGTIGIERIVEFGTAIKKFIIGLSKIPIIGSLFKPLALGVAEDLHKSDLQRIKTAYAKAKQETIDAINGAKPDPKKGLTDTGDGKDNPLAQIAAATTATADNTKKASEDLKRIAFGANIGALGVTAVEMDGMRRRRPSHSPGNILGLGNAIEAAIQQYVHDMMDDRLRGASFGR